MGPLKKLIISIATIIILLSLSYLPHDIGEFSLRFMALKVSTPVNLMLAACVVIWMGIKTILGLLKAVKSIFKVDENKIEKNSQDSLINLLFTENISDLTNQQKYHICEKYKNLKEAIECSLFEKFQILPKILWKISKTYEENTKLMIHKTKQNICKLIDDGNIEDALKHVYDVINKQLSYVPTIKDQILFLCKIKNLNFDPRKYKYNLSKQYIDEYIITAEMRNFHSSHDISILEKIYKNYPNNAEIAIELVKNSPNFSEKRIFSIIKNCFVEKPDRRLSIALLSIKKHENLFETALQITDSVPNNNIEKLWFLCTIASELGLTAKASEILQTIVKGYPEEVSQAIEFFILNLSKFSSNIELLQLIKGNIKNENRNNEVK